MWPLLFFGRKKFPQENKIFDINILQEAGYQLLKRQQQLWQAALLQQLPLTLELEHSESNQVKNSCTIFLNLH